MHLVDAVIATHQSTIGGTTSPRTRLFGPNPLAIAAAAAASPVLFLSNRPFYDHYSYRTFAAFRREAGASPLQQSSPLLARPSSCQAPWSWQAQSPAVAAAVVPPDDEDGEGDPVPQPLPQTKGFVGSAEVIVTNDCGSAYTLCRPSWARKLAQAQPGLVRIRRLRRRDAQVTGIGGAEAMTHMASFRLQLGSQFVKIRALLASESLPVNFLLGNDVYYGVTGGLTWDATLGTVRYPGLHVELPQINHPRLTIPLPSRGTAVLLSHDVILRPRERRLVQCHLPMEYAAYSMPACIQARPESDVQSYLSLESAGFADITAGQTILCVANPSPRPISLSRQHRIAVAVPMPVAATATISTFTSPEDLVDHLLDGGEVGELGCRPAVPQPVSVVASSSASPSTTARPSWPPRCRRLGHSRFRAPAVRLSRTVRQVDSRLPSTLFRPSRLRAILAQVTLPQHLSAAQSHALIRLLSEFPDVFHLDGERLRCSTVHSLSLDTGTSRPVWRKPYRLSFSERQLLRTILLDKIREGIIRPCLSPWAAPALVVPKPGKPGRWRLVADYRGLNKLLTPDRIALPSLSECLDTLSGARFFSALDLADSYHQVPLSSASQAKTAFSTPFGQYCYRGCPMGLSLSSGALIRTINTALGDVLWRFVVAFADDITVFSSTFEEHLLHLRATLHRLRAASLSLRPIKSSFCCREIRFLGHRITEDGVRPCPDKVAAIRDFPCPRSRREIHRFLGMAEFWRRFIPHFAALSAPLSDLLKRNAPSEFDRLPPAALTAFQRIKHYLSGPEVVLALPRFDREFILRPDACDVGIGSVLLQHDEQGRERPVAFFSQKLSPRERSWSTTEKELYAVVRSLQVFRPYLYGVSFRLETDHSNLRFLHSCTGPTRLARWAIKLGEFQFRVYHRPGRSAAMRVPDALSRAPVLPPHEGPCLSVVDSSMPLHEFVALPAAPMSSEPFLSDLGPLPTSAELHNAQRADPFFGPIVQHYESLTGNPSPSVSVSRRFAAVARQFHLDPHTGLLWRATPHRRQLCVPQSLRQRCLQHFHSSPVGGHFGFRRCMDRLARSHYWPHMARDLRRFIRSCPACQFCKTPRPQRRVGPMQPHAHVDPYFPLGAWHTLAFDVLSGLGISAKGNKHVLVVTDLVTKYTLFIPMPDQTASTIVSALLHEVFSKFGLPSRLYSDRGSNVDGAVLQLLSQRLGIQKIRTVAWHPASNGQCERLNHSLIPLLRAFCFSQPIDSWDLYLDSLQVAYNSASHASIGCSPFYALFGRECPTPFDLVSRPLMQMHKHLPLSSPQRRAAFLLQRRHAFEACRDFIARFQRRAFLRTKMYHDRGRVGVSYTPGSWVLRWTEANVRGQPPKLTPAWQGPYQVSRMVNPVVYELRIPGAGLVPVHVQNLSAYHHPPCPLVRPRPS